MYLFVSRVRASASANVLALDASYDVASAVTLPDYDHISPVAMQRMRRRLRHHVSFSKKCELLQHVLNQIRT